MIAEGIAEGGEDDDLYIILQSQQNAELVIKEMPLTGEAQEDAGKRAGSAIKLMYTLEQIKACDILQNGDIVMQLRNDNGTLTRLTLNEAYKDAKLQHCYIISTIDGFTLEHFPEQQPATSATFNVSYDPLKDALFQARIQDMALKDVQIIQNRSENSVTVGKTRILLPSFMGLYIKDTRLNDILIGDETSDYFCVPDGNNVMQGQAGEDIYVIPPNVSHQEIDNYDSATSPAQDLLMLSFAASSTFKTEGEDLIIADDPASSRQRVRIKNFMKGAEYQHLSLGLHEQIFDIRVDEQGIYLDERVKFTQGDDNIEVYHDSQIDGNGISGDDGNDHIFYFCEKNRTLSGGRGDDEIKVTSANHMISGDEGDDKIEGGTGDDTYCFKRGDGIDEITEQGGEDRLRLMGDIRADQVWLKKHLNHLKVIIGENGTDAVLFHGYFEGPEREIEQISLPGGNYSLKNYKAVMAEWSEDFYLSLDQLGRQHNGLQQKPPLVADTQPPSLLPEAISVFDTQEKSISPYAKIFSQEDRGALTLSA